MFRYVHKLAYPNFSGDTKQNMQIAINEFRDAEVSLTDLAPKIKERFYDHESSPEFKTNLFDETINKWKTYRDSRSNFKSDLFKGMVLYEIHFNIERTTITPDKISNLEQEFAEVLRREPFRKK